MTVSQIHVISQLYCPSPSDQPHPIAAQNLKSENISARWPAGNEPPLSQGPACVKSVAAPRVPWPTSLSEKPRVQRSISEMGECIIITHHHGACNQLSRELPLADGSRASNSAETVM